MNKKQFLLTITLGTSFLGLMAGELERKSKANTPSYLRYLQRATALFSRKKPAEKRFTELVSATPLEIKKLIAEFAGEFIKEQDYSLYRGLNAPGTLLAFSDDGTKLTSAGFTEDGRNVKIVTRSMKDGTKSTDITENLENPRLFDSVMSISGDGTTVAIDDDLINTDTKIKESHGSNTISINHNGTMLVTTMEEVSRYLNNQVSLFDRTTQDRFNLLLAPEIAANLYTIFYNKTYKFSRDGTTLACVAPNHIVLFDTNTGRAKKTIYTGIEPPRHMYDTGINSLALNRNGTLVAYSIVRSNKVILVNSLNDQQKLLSTIPHIVSVQFFTDSDDKLYFLSNPKGVPYIDFFDLATNKVTQRIQLADRGYIESSAISPDNKFLAIGFRDSIQLLKRSDNIQEAITREKQRAKEQAKKQLADKEAQARREVMKRIQTDQWLASKNPLYRAYEKQKKRRGEPTINQGSSSSAMLEPAVESPD